MRARTYDRMTVGKKKRIRSRFGFRRRYLKELLRVNAGPPAPGSVSSSFAASSSSNSENDSARTRECERDSASRSGPSLAFEVDFDLGGDGSVAAFASVAVVLDGREGRRCSDCGGGVEVEEGSSESIGAKDGTSIT